MHTRRVSVSVVLLVTAAGLLVGCSSSTTSSTTTSVVIGAVPNKAQFCSDNSKIDKAPAAASASTPAQILQVLKDNRGLLNDFGRTAPADVVAKVKTLVDGVDAAIRDNSTAELANVTSLGSAIDAYCGVNSEGNPIAAAG